MLHRGSPRRTKSRIALYRRKSRTHCCYRIHHLQQCTTNSMRKVCHLNRRHNYNSRNLQFLLHHRRHHLLLVFLLLVVASAVTSFKYPSLWSLSAGQSCRQRRWHFLKLLPILLHSGLNEKSKLFPDLSCRNPAFHLSSTISNLIEATFYFRLTVSSIWSQLLWALEWQEVQLRQRPSSIESYTSLLSFCRL